VGLGRLLPLLLRPLSLLLLLLLPPLLLLLLRPLLLQWLMPTVTGEAGMPRLSSCRPVALRSRRCSWSVLVQAEMREVSNREASSVGKPWRCVPSLSLLLVLCVSPCLLLLVMHVEPGVEAE